MRRRGGLSGLRPELEGDMPPRVEVRRRARQMQNEATRRADNVHPQLEQPVPQPAHLGAGAGGTRRPQPQLLHEHVRRGSQQDAQLVRREVSATRAVDLQAVEWFHQLQARGVTFVTRLKRGVRYRVTREHDIRPGTGVVSDQTIELTSARSRKAYTAPLRRVAYQDPVTKNRYVFVTNNTTWVAQTIADIYKSRWQIELFFKWIKQHLKVKRFVGRSKNAVMTQLWVAMCMYLLLAYLKFVMRLRWSLHQMLQVLQLNMFERRPLQDLFTTPSLPAPSGSQLSLAWS